MHFVLLTTEIIISVIMELVTFILLALACAFSYLKIAVFFNKFLTFSFNKLLSISPKFHFSQNFAVPVRTLEWVSAVVY